MLFKMIANYGLGLVVKVDLNSLSTISLNRCSFINTPEYWGTVLSVQDTGGQLEQSNIIRLGTIGTSGFISIVVADDLDEGTVTVPRPSMAHNFQGICAK